MATDIRILPANLDTDATFRIWGSGVAAQIAAMGLVKTADTGQIDWATVARPTVGTYAGYEMWRFADSLQATSPVFIKIEYGSLGAVDRPSLRVRAGTSTNGSGTLGGQLSSLVITAPNSSKAVGITHYSFCSGNPSRLNLCTNLPFAAGSGDNSVQIICVERMKTAAGVDMPDGFVYYGVSWNQVSWQAIPFSGTVPSAVGNNMALPLDNHSVSAVMSNIALSPTIVPLGKIGFASWLVYRYTDLVKFMPISVDHLGATRTIMPLGDGITGLIPYAQQAPGATNHTLAFLWE